jgi:uncharacterized protein involved in exopolysaccharide biosynthesis
MSLGLLLLIGIPTAGWLWWKNRGVEAYRYIRVMCLRNVHGEMIPQELEIEKQTQAAIIRGPLVISTALRTPGVTSIVKQWTTKDEIEALRDRLVVRMADRSEILEVTLRGQDPEATIKVLNAITDAYERDAINEEKLEVADKLRKLEQRHADAQKQLRETLKRIHEFEKTYESEAVSKVAEIELSSLVRQQERIEERLLETETQIATAQKLDSPPQSLDALQAQQTFLQQKLEQIKQGLQEQIGKMEAAVGKSVDLDAARMELGFQQRFAEDLQMKIEQLHEQIQQRSRILVLGQTAEVPED